ncbi:hypothetical protein GCM10010358_77870 [Streptomyces minutiscleroticus]|uniref:Lipoprotein n=1 Tax=Streptomyces minutiscleroticus TaxID=68238 RepID=A0A918P294_9ACTN|nr:hypothetical protein [Streptomyces minutiscleroticus]GGY14096.1 hypothetical protein GCM10010358_77870 [Streptomyces minutiscleroticus]
MVQGEGFSKRSFISLGVFLVSLALSSCSSADGSSKASDISSQSAGKSVAAAWARVQATEYSGCGEGSCEDYLTNLVQQLDSLKASMETASEKEFAQPIEIIDDISTPSPGSTDIDTMKEPILNARSQLKVWFSQHPDAAKGPVD